MRALGAGSGMASPGLRAAVTVVATSLLMVLVAWAALIGPGQVFTGPGPTPGTIIPTTRTCEPTGTPSATSSDTPTDTQTDTLTDPQCPEPDTTRDDAEQIGRQTEPPLWLKLLVWTFEILVLAGFVAFVAFLLTVAVRAAKRRTGRFAELAAVDFVTLDEPTRIASAIVEDADAQDALLRQGEPRNAIVAAWRRFEIQGARAGVDRTPSETSSEYALRILERVDAESHAVNELAGLYREARFSDHPIDESHRAAALSALDQIRRSLGVRA